jgi:hypothetical protein
LGLTPTDGRHARPQQERISGSHAPTVHASRIMRRTPHWKLSGPSYWPRSSTGPQPWRCLRRRRKNPTFRKGGQGMYEQTPYFVGWGTLTLINAGLAQAKGRSGLVWWLVSLFLGPLATFLIVVLPPVLSSAMWRRDVLRTGRMRGLIWAAKDEELPRFDASDCLGGASSPDVPGENDRPPRLYRPYGPAAVSRYVPARAAAGLRCLNAVNPAVGP